MLPLKYISLSTHPAILLILTVLTHKTLPGKEDLHPYVAWRRKRHMRKGLRKSYRIDKWPLPSIELRPKETDKRNVIGHWEDDLIVSSVSKPKLKTANERVSGVETEVLKTWVIKNWKKILV